MPKYAKIGNAYWSVGSQNTLQRVSESDIVNRSGKIETLINQGDLVVLKPEDLQFEYLSPRSDRPNGAYQISNLTLGGSNAYVYNKATLDALGVDTSKAPNILSGGSIKEDTDYAEYLNSQNKRPDARGSDAGSSGGSSQQPAAKFDMLVRRKGTDEVWAISNGGSYYVPYQYALDNKLFDKVKEVDFDISKKYPIAGNVSMISADGSNQGGAGAGSGAGAGAGAGSSVLDLPTNMEFQKSDAYKNLSKEEKELVDLAFNMIHVGGENEAKIFANAISKAKAVADPYFRAKLSLVQAEIGGSIADLNDDFDTKKEIIERTKKELAEDISIAKDALTLEQQAELSKITRDLDEDLLMIADNAADKGLTFSEGYKSRARAEELKKTEASSVIQSTNRISNLKLKELELKASRGDTNAQAQLAALDKGKTSGLSKIGRKAEELLGTMGLSEVSGLGSGYDPVGGVKGSIEHDKSEAILKDVKAFIDLQKGFL